jgi:hypothetical protein
VAAKFAAVDSMLAELRAMATPVAPVAPEVSPAVADPLVVRVLASGRAVNDGGYMVARERAEDPDGLLAVASRYPGRPIYGPRYTGKRDANGIAVGTVSSRGRSTVATAAQTVGPAVPTLRGRLLEQIAPAAQAPVAAPVIDPVEDLLADVAAVRELPGAELVLRAIRMIHDKHAAGRGKFFHADVDAAFGFREPRPE